MGIIAYIPKVRLLCGFSGFYFAYGYKLATFLRFFVADGLCGSSYLVKFVGYLVLFVRVEMAVNFKSGLNLFVT